MEMIIIGVGFLLVGMATGFLILLSHRMLMHLEKFTLLSSTSLLAILTAVGYLIYKSGPLNLGFAGIGFFIGVASYVLYLTQRSRRTWIEPLSEPRYAYSQRHVETEPVPPPRESYASYDIVISFAGEDRHHAEAIAQGLRANHIRVFYDEYEKASLWGKNLYDYLERIYKDSAFYCVMLLSEHYAGKLWTNHERKSAQARAFKNNREYILPIKLDDTEIPGISDTVAYVDLRHTSIDEVQRLIIEKLEGLQLSAFPEGRDVLRRSDQ